MTNTFYKAVRVDGTDFHSGRVDWAGAVGATVSHPTGVPNSLKPREFFSMATSPEGCLGARWPCRLLEVEATEFWLPDRFATPGSRAAVSLSVVRELPASLLLGPNAGDVVAFLDRIQSLSSVELYELASHARRLGPSGFSTWHVMRNGQRVASYVAARLAAAQSVRSLVGHPPPARILGLVNDHWEDRAITAVGDAIGALVLRDLLTPEHFNYEFNFPAAPHQGNGRSRPADQAGADPAWSASRPSTATCTSCSCSGSGRNKLIAFRSLPLLWRHIRQ